MRPAPNSKLFQSLDPEAPLHSTTAFYSGLENNSAEEFSLREYAQDQGNARCAKGKDPIFRRTSIHSSIGLSLDEGNATGIRECTYSGLFGQVESQPGPYESYGIILLEVRLGIPSEMGKYH